MERFSILQIGGFICVKLRASMKSIVLLGVALSVLRFLKLMPVCPTHLHSNVRKPGKGFASDEEEPDSICMQDPKKRFCQPSLLGPVDFHLEARVNGHPLLRAKAVLSLTRCRATGLRGWGGDQLFRASSQPVPRKLSAPLLFLYFSGGGIG